MRDHHTGDMSVSFYGVLYDRNGMRIQMGIWFIEQEQAGLA